MAAPTAADVRTWSRIDFDSLGYASGDPDGLEFLVERAAQYVTWATGRDWSSMPSELRKIAEEAVQLVTETLAYQSQEDIVETAADFMLISSFSAGSYSETRRSMAEMKNSGMIHANPLIHGLLWSLLTDDKRDDWLSWMTGQNAPAFAVTEVNWSQGDPWLPTALPDDPFPLPTD